MKALFEIFLAISLVATGIPAAPRAWPAIVLLSAGDDTVAVAEYHLASSKEQDFEAAAAHALNQMDGGQDTELAASLRDLSASRGITFSPELSARIDEAIRNRPLIPVGELWDGFLQGKATTEIELAAAIAADLIGFGDFRDLWDEAKKYLSGEQLDKLVVMFAAAGVILTAVTAFTLGAPIMEKAGVSTLKIARKMNKIPESFSKEILDLAGRAVDMKAFGRVADAILDWPTELPSSFSTYLKSYIDGIIVAVKSFIRPQEYRKIKAMGDDVITLGKRTGYRGVVEALEVSDSAADLNRRVKLAEAYGTRARAVFKMLAKATLSFADLIWTIFAWATGAAIWAIAVASLLLSWSMRLAQSLRRRVFVGPTTV